MIAVADGSDDADLLDFRALLATLLAKRWYIVASVILGTAIFTAAAFLITPVYRGAVILMPASHDSSSDGLSGALGQLGGLASVVGLNVGSRGAETEEALAVLRSRQFTERFIDDNKLMPKLFADVWDAARGQWKVSAEKQPTPARAYKYFNTKIRSIIQDKKTGLVTIQVDWTDRREAAEWANDLAQRLNEEMRGRAIGKADASVGFLEKELQSTSTVDTRDAIGRLIEAQIKQRMLANVTREYAFRVVDKAMPADADDPIKPKKLKLMAVGPLVGFVLGVLWILVSNSLRRGTSARPDSKE